METLNKSLEEKNRRMQELQLEFNPQERAMVQVRGEVYPGTTIIIGDSSMQVKSTYCLLYTSYQAGDLHLGLPVQIFL